MSESSVSLPELTLGQRLTVLVAAFLGWMFAGLQIALFVLIHRSAMTSLHQSSAQLANAASTAISEQVITQWFAWFQAAFLFGAAAGGWVFGVLGDRLGRTRSLGLSILCYSLVTGLCYFARTPGELLILRFLACFGIGGTWPNTVALVAEAWPAASRPLLAGVLGTAANVGQVAMGGIGLSFDVVPDSWRWTFLVGALPAVIGLWCLIAVPESARWQASRSRRLSAQQGPVRELFRPPLRYRTMIGILLGTIPVVGTAANAQWIVPWSDQVQMQQRSADKTATADAIFQQQNARPKADPKSKARTMMSRSGGAVIGSLLGGILASFLGRRTTYFLISLLALCASSWIFGWLTPSDPRFLWASFGFGLVGVIYFGWLPLYLPELFPTHVRASGTGISFNSGRTVAALVVLGTGLLVKQFGGDYARIGLWTGLIYVVGMVVILFAPRTDADSLRD